MSNLGVTDTLARTPFVQSVNEEPLQLFDLNKRAITSTLCKDNYFEATKLIQSFFSQPDIAGYVSRALGLTAATCIDYRISDKELLVRVARSNADGINLLENNENLSHQKQTLLQRIREFYNACLAKSIPAPYFGLHPIPLHGQHHQPYRSHHPMQQSLFPHTQASTLLEPEVQKLREENTKLKTELVALQKERDQAAQVKARAEQRIAVLQAALDEESDARQRENLKYQTALAELSENLTKAEEKNEQLEQKLQEKTAELQLADTMLKALWSEVDHLKEENDAFLQLEAQTTRALSEAKSKLATQEKALAENLKQLEIINKEKGALELRLAQLNTPPTIDPIAVNRLTLKLLATEAQVKRIQEELAKTKVAKQDQTVQTEDEKNPLTDQLNVANKAVKDLTSQVAAKKQEIIAAQKELAQSEQEKNRLAQELKAIEAIVDSLKQQLGKIETTQASEREAAQAEISRKTREIAQLQQQLKTGEETRSLLQAELAAVKERNETLTGQLETQTRDLEQLNQSLAIEKGVVADLREQLQAAKTTHENLQAQASSQKARNEQLETELAAAQREKTKILAELTTEKRLGADKNEELTAIRGSLEKEKEQAKKREKSTLKKEAELTRENHELRQQLKVIDATQTELLGKKQRLDELVEANKKHIGKLEGALQEAEKSRLKETEALNGNLAAAHATISQVEKDLTDAKAKEAQLADEKESLARKSEEAKAAKQKALIKAATALATLTGEKLETIFARIRKDKELDSEELFAAYQQLIASQKEELNRVKTKIEELNKIVAELEMQAEEKRAFNEEKHRELLEKSQNVEIIVKENIHSAADVLAKTLGMSLDELLKRLTLEGEVDLQLLLKEYENQLVARKRQVSESQKQIDLLKSQNQDNAEKTISLIEEKNALKSSVDKLEAQLATTQTNLDQLESQKEFAQKSKKSAEEKYNDLIQEKRTLIERIAHLQAEECAQRDKINNLEQASKEAQTEKEELSLLNKKNQKEINKLKKALQQALHQVEHTQKNIESLLPQMVNLETEKKAATSKILEQKADIERLQSDTNRFRASLLAGAFKEWTQHEEKTKKLKSELEAEREKAKKANTTLEEKEVKIYELTTALNGALATTNLRDHELLQSNESLQTAYEKLQQLDATRGTQAKEIHSLNSTIKDLRETIATMEEELSKQKKDSPRTAAVLLELEQTKKTMSYKEGLLKSAAEERESLLRKAARVEEFQNQMKQIELEKKQALSEAYSTIDQLSTALEKATKKLENVQKEKELISRQLENNYNESLEISFEQKETNAALTEKLSKLADENRDLEAKLIILSQDLATAEQEKIKLKTLLEEERRGVDQLTRILEITAANPKIRSLQEARNTIISKNLYDSMKNYIEDAKEEQIELLKLSLQLLLIEAHPIDGGLEKANAPFTGVYTPKRAQSMKEKSILSFKFTGIQSEEIQTISPFTRGREYTVNNLPYIEKKGIASPIEKAIEDINSTYVKKIGAAPTAERTIDIWAAPLFSLFSNTTNPLEQVKNPHSIKTLLGFKFILEAQRCGEVYNHQDQKELLDAIRNLLSAYREILNPWKATIEDKLSEMKNQGIVAPKGAKRSLAF